MFRLLTILMLFRLSLLGASSPCNCLHPFWVNGKFGYLRPDGTIAITPQFEFARDFRDGLAAVRVADYWSFIDENGAFVTTMKARREPQNFSEGLLASPATEQGNSGWGYRDRSGRFVVAPQFRAVADFSEGLAAAWDDLNWVYINQQGQRAFEGEFEKAGPFRQGMAAVAFRGKFGFINDSGRFIIPPQFQSAGDFNDGRAAVSLDRSGSKWAFIDGTGKILTRSDFDQVKNFSEGLAAVRMADGPDRGLWGFIDIHGAFAIPPRFREADSFSHGLAAVKDVSRWQVFGYIDRSGSFILTPRYVVAERFSSDGVAKVDLEVDPSGGARPGSAHGQQWSAYIRRDGGIVWQAQ